MNQATVDAIRDWEMDAGESFTDYFLDRYSYDWNGGWMEFLKDKGYGHLVQECYNSRYKMKDGSYLLCTDQQLKFEPHSSKVHDGWSEDVYLKDVALWVEFINSDEKVLADFNEFLAGEEE